MRLAAFLAAAGALAAACVAGSTAASAQAAPAEANPPRAIEVTGEASIDAPPDFARVTIGVTTAGKDAREAMAANADAMNALISTIKGEGVAPADIQTSGLTISPSFSSMKSNSGPPTIVGYTVGDTVTVTARDLSRLGALLDKAVGGGANAMYGVSFGSNDVSALLDKARPLAVADAKRKADIYATAAGAKVGRLMELSEGNFSGPAPMAGRIFASAAKAAPTPIEPGQDKLTVTITARYELTQ
jgi:uncharacterized protein YggE